MQSANDDWEQKYAEKVIMEEREYLQIRRETDPHFTPEYMRLMLNELYQSEGDGAIGKEALNELRQASKIAAYEGFLADWEHEVAEAKKAQESK